MRLERGVGFPLKKHGMFAELMFAHLENFLLTLDMLNLLEPDHIMHGQYFQGKILGRWLVKAKGYGGK